MPRRPAKVTQADISRALRAAKAIGGFAVEIAPDGTVKLVPFQGGNNSGEKPAAKLATPGRALL